MAKTIKTQKKKFKKQKKKGILQTVSNSFKILYISKMIKIDMLVVSSSSSMTWHIYLQTQNYICCKCIFNI